MMTESEFPTEFASGWKDMTQPELDESMRLHHMFKLGPLDRKCADLGNGVIRGADLTGPKLSNAFIMQTALTDAILRSAKLHKAALSQSNLTGSVLAGADLSEATLTGALFHGAILARAIMH